MSKPVDDNRPFDLSQRLEADASRNVADPDLLTNQATPYPTDAAVCPHVGTNRFNWTRFPARESDGFETSIHED